MAQTNYTPVSLYYSTTAGAIPTNTNLVSGELALNITDGKLYYKDDTNTVQLLASKTASSNVTSVSVVSANGLAGTVADPTTTPAITLSTTASGVLKGSAGALIAASPGVDFAPATTGTSILYANGSGGFSSVTIGSNLNFTGGTLSATTGGGTTVTSFSAGTTGLTPATASYNNIVLGGTLATTNGGTGLTSFTANGAIYASSTSVLSSGTLPTASGGTGLTTFTSGGAVYASSTSALTTGTLPITAGGTGMISATAGGAVYAASSAALTTGTLPVTAGGTAKTSWTTGAVYATGSTTLVSGTLPTSAGGTGLASFTSGGAVYASSTSALTTGTLPVASGGTAKTSWTNGAVYVSSNTFASGTLPVSSGGTGVTSSTGSSSVVLSSSPTIYSATFTGNYIGVGANAIVASDRVSIAYNSTAGGFNANMLSLSGAGTDIASGAQVVFTNPNAALGVRTKYLRMNQTGDLEILNTGYTFPIIQFADNGNVNIQGGSLYLFNGTGYQPGGGSWGVYSDARLKENVQPLSGSLEKILALKPVTFDWKYETKEISTGFIAQEVLAVIPTAVSEIDPTDSQKQFLPEGEKALTIGWKNDMTAYLVGAIQELKAELDAAKARIAQLEAK